MPTSPGLQRTAVPPKAPVRRYWSATVTIRRPRAHSRSNKIKPRLEFAGTQQNPDVPVDVYFGFKAPVGKESNWVPGRGGEKFEILFRLYGPEQALFEKT